MRLAKNPVYRKEIVPWYDSETACYIFIVFMFFVFLFGFLGIMVAYKFPQYKEHICIPVFLVISSLFAGLSTIIRLVRRYKAGSRKSHKRI